MHSRDIIEALFGHKLRLGIVSPGYGYPHELMALVSRNSRTGERPYRLTWFQHDPGEGFPVPWGHVDLETEEAAVIVHDHRVPSRVEVELARYIRADEFRVYPARATAGVAESALNDELQAFEKALMRRYPQLRILAMYMRSEDANPHIYVSSIEVAPVHRGKGIGTRVMGEIQAWAKERGLPVALSRDDTPGRKAPLNRFYGRLGFARNKGRKLDSRVTATHIYRPE